MQTRQELEAKAQQPTSDPMLASLSLKEKHSFKYLGGNQLNNSLVFPGIFRGTLRNGLARGIKRNLTNG